MLIPYEHLSAGGRRVAWPGMEGQRHGPRDRLQVVAYAALLEEHTGRTVTEGRVRYHADNAMVRLMPMDAQAHADLQR